jgi:hypothetical protein
VAEFSAELQISPVFRNPKELNRKSLDTKGTFAKMDFPPIKGNITSVKKKLKCPLFGIHLQ